MCLCGGNIKVGKQKCCDDLFRLSPEKFKLYLVTAIDDGDYYVTVAEQAHIVATSEENALAEAKYNVIPTPKYGRWEEYEVELIDEVQGFKITFK